MNHIKWVTNHVATAFQTSNASSFIYPIAPLTTEQPDCLIIRQINVCCDVTANSTGGPITVLAYNLQANINSNSIIGSINMPYNYEYNATGNVTALSFVSNPQTHIQLTSPLGPSITFSLTIPNGGSAIPATYFISISFDLIKYTK